MPRGFVFRDAHATHAPPSGPPAPEWPGPHAPYPFPNDVPHRTE